MKRSHDKESRVLIACHTIEDELNLAIRATGFPHPVFWVDSKLHIKPEKLKAEIQAAIDRIGNVSTMILAFGCCGNALVGIKSATARLVFPKVEDCISLLLGSAERRQALSKETSSYWLTRGWIESENNIAHEYEYSVRRFGAERALKLMRTMLKNYRHLSLIDTGAYDIARCRVTTERLAETLALKHIVVKGSQRFLEKLLTGPWDDEFVEVAPGQEITMECFLKWHKEEQVGQVC